MLRCVVLDDEPLAREVLEGYLYGLDYVKSVSSFGAVEEALSYLKEHEAEVLFLDIEMPGMTGIEFLQSLDNPPVTVFTTAYRHYAFEGFELGVIDFLLKPIAYTRFLQTIEKIRDFYSLREQLADLDQISTEESTESIMVKSGVQRFRLNLDDILYIQGLKDYAIVYTTLGKVVLKGSVKAMQGIFPTPRFIRVHRSFIVAIAKISGLERSRLLVEGGNYIPIGRNYKGVVKKRLADYGFS